MKLELRDYQAKAVGAVKWALVKKDNCLLVAPCGAGKTVIFSEVVSWLHQSGRKCLILLDRENLVSQTAKRMAEHIGPYVGVACSSVSSRKDLRKPVVVASRQTLAPMLKNGSKNYKTNIVILDEAHLCNPKAGQYKDILNQLKENHPALRVMGCTATPYRLSGGKIYGKSDSLFDEVDYRVTTEELLNNGYLVPLSWKIRKSDLNAQLDLVKKSSTGDLNEAEQYKVLGKDTYVRGVFDAWAEYCRDRKTAIYALNIQHAELIKSVFESEGIKVWLIHSKMNTKQVRKCIAEYTAGNGVIINVGILTIGTDIPSISSIILARRTLSTALFFQIVGRGARISPGKQDCLVVDLCANALIHGIDPDNPVRNEKEERTWDIEPKIKVCPMCETAHSLSARACKECGFEFPYEEKEPEEVRDSGDKPELVDFDGFRKVECDHVRYYLHPGKNGKPPTIRAEYRRVGVVVGKQWLCPQHIGFPKQKAGRYWRELGGKWPVPKTVVEWIQRNGELEHRLILTINFTGKYPEIKKVKILRGEEYAQSITKDRQHRAAV